MENQYNEQELDKKIQNYIEFVNKKRLNESSKQNILTDYFNRYLFKYNKIDLALIDCIKGFYKDKKYQDRFDEIVKKYNLNNMTETNRLLLIQSIYVSSL